MARPSVTLYLHVHQPWRIRRYPVFDISRRHDYFAGDDPAQDNRRLLQSIAATSYRPMNHLLQRLLTQQPGFRLSLSLSGSFLEQAQAWAPDVVADFQRLVATGRVELVLGPSHHSLAFFYSQREFEEQIVQQQQTLRRLFGVTPRVLANTELAYTNQLGQWAEEHGFDGVLLEGWDPLLARRSPGALYRPPGTRRVKLLLRQYRLSDDISFRFSNTNWSQWPLTAPLFCRWLHAASASLPLINLCMDYETFGEHQRADSGIFDFFEQWVIDWLASGGRFYTASQALASRSPSGELNVPQTVTWADSERDLTAWHGNQLQAEALRYIYHLEPAVRASADPALLEDWRRLQASDHFYYMATKWSTDGDVHTYFSPYNSPYDAFLYYMNAVRDLGWRLEYAKTRQHT